MARIIIFDTPTIMRINEVVAYAHKHPLSMDDMLDIMNKDRNPPGNFQEHVVILSLGLKCVYSEEQQNVGLCKHLSVSTDVPGKLPNPAVVAELMPLFGITAELEDCVVDLEEFAPNHQAVNIVELPEIKSPG